MLITSSKKFRLNVGDLLKGLLVAVISPIFTIIKGSLDQGSMTFNWNMIATTGIAAGGSYLIKNFFTPSSTTVTPDLDSTISSTSTTTTIITTKSL